MTVKLLTEKHLDFLSLKGGCTASFESTHVKMPHCWKTHVTAHLFKHTCIVIYVIQPSLIFMICVIKQNDSETSLKFSVSIFII